MKGIFDILIKENILSNSSAKNTRFGKGVIYSDENKLKLNKIKEYLKGDSNIKIITTTPTNNLSEMKKCLNEISTTQKKKASKKAEEIRNNGLSSIYKSSQENNSPNIKMNNKRIYCKKDEIIQKPQKREYIQEENYLLSQDSQLDNNYYTKSSIIHDPIHQV